MGHQYGEAVLVRVCRTLVFAAVVAVIAVGCADKAALPADADAEIITGHEVFGARCARCHGADGGGGIGPSLRDVEERLSDDQQRDVLQNGRKSMPRFDGLLTPEEIDAVVRYSREILSPMS